MKERKITNEEKIYFTKRQESHFYDKKAKEIGGKKIQKIAVAFANAGGGDFIVGIKDDKDEPDYTKRWVGEINKEAFNDVFQNLIEISPSIPYTPEFLLDEGTNSYATVLLKQMPTHLACIAKSPQANATIKAL